MTTTTTTRVKGGGAKRRAVAWAVAGACALLVAAPVAWSTASLTPKQALVRGAPAAVKVAPEGQVSRMIVRFRDELPEGRRARLAEFSVMEGVDFQPVRELAGGASLVSLGGAMPLSQAKALAARMAANPAVEYAEPDVLLKRAMVPNEPRYTDWQWNLYPPTASYSGNPPKSVVAAGGANLPTAWDVSKGGASSVVIAVIDTGIVNHPDLNGIGSPSPYVPSGRFVAGYDFISADAGGLPTNFVANDGDGRDPDPTDPGDWITAADSAAFPNDCGGGAQASSWHGTHMAGIAAATTNNGIGIAGIAWNARIQPVRALGKCGGALSDISEAIRWAAGLPVSGVPANGTPALVISLSLGSGDACSQTMQDAVNSAAARGAVVVAAAGNDGNVGLITPANCTGVVSVTAHVINGENADYANVAPATTISAPGGGKPSALGVGTAIDDPSWTGYAIWSTLLFGATTPDSADTQGRSGPAYGGFTGTSAATPHVAGVAALIKSVLPNATPAQVQGFITSTARSFPAGSICAPGGSVVGQCGAGLLDATAALNAAVATAPPSIVDGPTSVSVFEGQAATLTVNAVGAAPLTYQWKRNGTTIAGATGSSYTTPALALTDSGAQYSVTVTNALGTVNSGVATVTVSAVPVVPPPSGGGGGGGALPLAQLLLLAALLLAARVRQRE